MLLLDKLFMELLWEKLALEPLKISEYDQEIPKAHTADQPTTPWDRATEHL